MSPAAGWYPDPGGQPGAVRWWDGSQWTHHQQPGGGGGYGGGPGANQYVYGGGGAPLADPYSYRRSTATRYRSGTFSQRNRDSFLAIGIGALYMVIAVATHFVLLGIVPLMASVRAMQRREALAPLAVVVAIAVIVVSLTVLTHHSI
jgi:hypothetical protein